MPKQKSDTEVFAFRVKPESIARLRQIARKDSGSIGTLLNMIVEQFLSNHTHATSGQGNYRPFVLASGAIEIMLREILRQVARASAGPILEDVALADFRKAARHALEHLQQAGLSPKEEN